MRSNSSFPQLPSDLVEKISLDYFSFRDLQALILTCRSHNQFFNTPRAQGFWYKLFLRDFGFAPDFSEASMYGYTPKSMCYAFYPEADRLIAHALVMLNRVQHMPETSVDYFRRNLDKPENDPSVILSTFLKLSDYRQFSLAAQALLTHVHPDVLQRQIKMLSRVIGLLCFAPQSVLLEKFTTFLPTISAAFESNVNIEQPLENACINIILSLFSKCGATHLLKRLLARLDDESRDELFRICGSHLCRDAALFGQKDILHLLLTSSRQLDEEGLPLADRTAVHSELSNEPGLLPLQCALMSLTELWDSTLQGKLDIKRRAVLLRDYGIAVYLLCDFGARPHRGIITYCGIVMGAAVSLDTTIYNLAENLFANIQQNQRCLSEPEAGMLLNHLCCVLDIPQYEVSVEEFSDEEKPDTPRKNMRDEDEWLEDESDKNPSPKKKSKIKSCAPNKEDKKDHSFPDGDDNDPQVMASPARNLFSKMRV